MKTYNYGDPYTVKINVRFTEQQFKTLVATSTALGITPSACIRKLVDSLGGMSNENVKTDSDNQLQQ